jgi:hypothetical protein
MSREPGEKSWRRIEQWATIFVLICMGLLMLAFGAGLLITATSPR